MALNAGFNAGMMTFRRVYNDPETFLYKRQYQNWNDRYAMLWSYYINSALDDYTLWAYYRSLHRLYKFTRSIYNPTRKLVDFYVGTIYPGILTADARRFEDGTVIAIPFADSTPRRLINAIASLWKWSNWQSNKNLMVRYAACMGDCLVEIIDDLEKNQIEFQVQHPGVVDGLKRDFRGNVKEYAIEYQYDEVDPSGMASTTYTFRKTVDKNNIRYYRNGKPHAYDGVQSSYENPYGFVPAVWIQHVDVGTQHGEPAMRNMSKFDELNSLASHTIDQAHRILEAPLLVSGEGIQSFNPEAPPDGAVADGRRPDAMRSNIPMIKGSLGARIDAVQPPAGESRTNIEALILDIEKDHPELTMHHEMRRMSQVTGPAVTRLFGDVEISVNEARANYDIQMVKAHQMSIAIGGMRANAGDWGPVEDLHDDQAVFLPFDLDSYREGDLDFEIAARPLVPLGQWETIQAQRAEVSLERERLILAATKADPLGAGAPSGDQTSQIGNRLRMRSATEGVLQTLTPPSA